MQPLECARPVVQCMSASHKCVPWGLALLLCMRVRGPRLKLWQLVTPRIQATPTSTTFLRAEFRGLDGHGEIRGVRRRKEEWTQPKEGEENIKEKQTERRWGGGGDTAHAFHNRQKAFNTLRISNYWERSAPSHCVTACGLLSCLTWGRFGKTIEKAIVREARPSKIPQQIWFPQKCTKHFFFHRYTNAACERLLVCHVFGWADVWTGVSSLPGPCCVEGIKAFVSVQRKWLWT